MKEDTTRPLLLPLLRSKLAVLFYKARTEDLLWIVSLTGAEDVVLE